MNSNGQNIDGFSTAVSGLNAQQSKLELVGNNIANINTIGYKSKRMTFAEQFGSTKGISFTPFKQAGFQILWGVTMPNILIEVGFITNKEEAKNLISKKYQSKVANSIVKAIINYKNKYEQHIIE